MASPKWRAVLWKLQLLSPYQCGLQYNHENSPKFNNTRRPNSKTRGITNTASMRNLASVLLSLLVCGTIPNAALAATVTRMGDVVQIRGPLVHGDAIEFERALEGPVRLVRIRSPGGQLSEALRIGQLVQSRGLEVEVLGLCASACAQLILPAARLARIEDGSIIAMHAAAEGALLAAESEGRFEDLQIPVLGAVLENLRSMKAAMADHFKTIHINGASMSFMYALTSTSDVVSDRADR